ncbi:MAG: 3-deoxy-8-phosphooctulonate synthase [Bacteroidetes bacterium]|nr:MAG: 3-deoxy-8-phosphooctulonate synthase [Bacteroidota bacterium]
MKQSNNTIRLNNITIGGGSRIVLIAGPCVIEGRDITLRTAGRIKGITAKLNIPFIFKSSYKKANRTSGTSFAGLSMEKALRILSEVKRECSIPILTDVHTEGEIDAVAEIADVIQIPAFLCRQTELLQAAGRTKKIVNIKKGQFMAPEDMAHQAHKVEMTGNKKILLTERGASFGYHNLVVDMRSLVIMRSLGYPVILDATHSVQLPGGGKNVTGGQPEFIAPIARAGAAVGIDGLFVETHPNPAKAKSDAASQLKLDLLEQLLAQVIAIDTLVKEEYAA